MPPHRAVPRLERLKEKAGFERALGRGPAGVLAKSPHFVLHFSPVLALPQDKLSTGSAPEGELSVDDAPSGVPVCAAGVVKVGTVLPKRLARRAVTRNLLKRQIHAASTRALPQLSPGIWVLRLRSPIDRAEFPSAASQALRLVVRAELDALLAQAARRLAGRRAPDGAAPASPGAG